MCGPWTCDEPGPTKKGREIKNLWGPMCMEEMNILVVIQLRLFSNASSSCHQMELGRSGGRLFRGCLCFLYHCCLYKEWIRGGERGRIRGYLMDVVLPDLSAVLVLTNVAERSLRKVARSSQSVFSIPLIVRFFLEQLVGVTRLVQIWIQMTSLNSEHVYNSIFYLSMVMALLSLIILSIIKRPVMLAPLVLNTQMWKLIPQPKSLLKASTVLNPHRLIKS